MVLESRRPTGEFHASMQRVEQELYRAQYSAEINPDDPDAREIPDYHIGTDAATVKVRVEQMAQGLGYERVVWDELPSD